MLCPALSSVLPTSLDPVPQPETPIPWASVPPFSSDPGVGHPEEGADIPASREEGPGGKARDGKSEGWQEGHLACPHHAHQVL